MYKEDTVLVGTYSPALVLLSVLVAVMAVYCAFMLSRRVGHSEHGPFSIWAIASAAAMGVGIWSMHFIAMMAFKLPIPVTFDLTLTLASLFLPILMLWVVLYIFSRATMSNLMLLSTGVLTGLAVGGQARATCQTGSSARPTSIRLSPPTGPIRDTRSTRKCTAATWLPPWTTKSWLSSSNAGWRPHS